MPTITPQQITPNLLLRPATPADIPSLAQFNARLHADPGQETDPIVDSWTKLLLDGSHPTTNYNDAIIVEDTTSNQIVSSLIHISQTWLYEDITFTCGRAELIGTHPDYRRQGLVRAQMNAFHAYSAAKGEQAQIITGIPWYYRQFDYEMTLDWHGSFTFFWNRSGNNTTPPQEKYNSRPATTDDIPLLHTLYQIHGQHQPINRQRTDDIWRYELTTSDKVSIEGRQFHLITSQTDDQPIAYYEVAIWGQRTVVREFAVLPNHNWHDIALFLTRHLKPSPTADQDIGQTPYLQWHLGSNHPVYNALGQTLEPFKQRPYPWYIRLPNIPQFLHHITPVLNQRLAHSLLAGYTGTLKLNFYHQHHQLTFNNGQLTTITPYQPTHFTDGDAFFPQQTFLQLLFCHRTLAELNHVIGDCYATSSTTKTLLQILFPKQPSKPVSLG